MNGPRKPLTILYQDDAVVLIDKPAGLASVPSPGVDGRTCRSELQRTHPDVVPIHRLDRETSGVLLFARKREHEAALIEQFREREVEKVYHLVVRGHPRQSRGTIRRKIKDHGKKASLDPAGQEAVTEYRVIRHVGPATLVEAKPLTGRYNQLRLHFQALGHALIGERKYAHGKDDPVRFRRVALHAARLTLKHPVSGSPIRVRSHLPPDLTQLLEQLEACEVESAKPARGASSPRAARSNPKRRDGPGKKTARQKKAGRKAGGKKTAGPRTKSKSGSRGKKTAKRTSRRR